jgi:hypothetical protein
MTFVTMAPESSQITFHRIVGFETVPAAVGEPEVTSCVHLNCPTGGKSDIVPQIAALRCVAFVASFWEPSQEVYLSSAALPPVRKFAPLTKSRAFKPFRYELFGSLRKNPIFHLIVQSTAANPNCEYVGPL